MGSAHHLDQGQARPDSPRHEPEVNAIDKGTVQRIVDFGAFIQILPNTDGLLHISEIAHHRIERVEDVLHEGDTVEVKVLSIDRGPRRDSGPRGGGGFGQR